MTTDTAPYALGFTSLEDELTYDDIPVVGTLPDWLRGSLLRNGPAKFEAGDDRYIHWFDGLAMLHRFNIANGRVAYRNRFLKSRAYERATQAGRIVQSEFMTDPCRTLFGRVMTLFDNPGTDNAAVSLSQAGDDSIAMTETPIPIRFDPDTLATLGPLAEDARLGGQVTTAHPHRDARQSYNYAIAMGRKSYYQMFADDGEGPRLLCKIATDRPAYMHSFGMSEHYLVLAEFPLRVNPLRLKFAGITGQPFMRNYRWLPEEGTRFTVIDKNNGEIVARATADPCFAFHHVNAFEADGALHVDLIAYPNADIIDNLRLAKLRSDTPIDAGGQLTRFSIPLGDGDADRPMRVDSQVLCEAPIELARIDYARRAGQPIRCIWGVGQSAGQGFMNNITRIVLPDQSDAAATVALWEAPGCYPGEPIFVPRPGGEAEDDGVILSVVLDAEAGHSFLIVLDARTLTELARATVPHHIPFGLHGVFRGAPADTTPS